MKDYGNSQTYVMIFSILKKVFTSHWNDTKGRTSRKPSQNCWLTQLNWKKGHQTSGSAIAEGPRDVLVSRNSATTKYRYRVALFA